MIFSHLIFCIHFLPFQRLFYTLPYGMSLNMINYIKSLLRRCENVGVYISFEGRRMWSELECCLQVGRRICLGRTILIDLKCCVERDGIYRKI